MELHLDRLLLYLSSFLLLLGCSEQPKKIAYGSLIFHSSQETTLNLFKVNKNNTFQSVPSVPSNKKLKLESGKYFAQADCGSKEFNIIPKQTLSIDINHIQIFKNTSTLIEKIHVNCKVNSRQKAWKYIKNQNNIAIFDKRSQIKVNNILVTTEELNSLKINLQELKVTGNLSSKSRYHIQNLDNNDSIISVNLGDSVLLPIRKYSISLHGSKKTIFLDKNTVIKTGEIITKIRDLGFPKKNQLNTMKINGSFGFNIQKKSLALLPGKIRLHYLNNFIDKEVEITSNKQAIIYLEPIQITNNCPFQDRTCMKNSFIHLTEKKSKKRLQKINSLTEFYNIKKSNFLFTLNNSSFIFFKSKTIKNNQIKTSRLTIIPKFTYKKNILSDLIRLYPSKVIAEGSSKDLAFTTSTTLELIDGRYQLKHFINDQKSKKRTSKNISINLNKDLTVYVDTYISRNSQKRLERKNQESLLRNYRSSLQNFQKKHPLQTYE